MYAPLEIEGGPIIMVLMLKKLIGQNPYRFSPGEYEQYEEDNDVFNFFYSCVISIQPDAINMSESYKKFRNTGYYNEVVERDKKFYIINIKKRENWVLFFIVSDRPLSLPLDTGNNKYVYVKIEKCPSAATASSSSAIEVIFDKIEPTEAETSSCPDSNWH